MTSPRSEEEQCDSQREHGFLQYGQGRGDEIDKDDRLIKQTMLLPEEVEEDTVGRDNRSRSGIKIRIRPPRSISPNQSSPENRNIALLSGLRRPRRKGRREEEDGILLGGASESGQDSEEIGFGDVYQRSSRSSKSGLRSRIGNRILPIESSKMNSAPLVSASESAAASMKTTPKRSNDRTDGSQQDVSSHTISSRRRDRDHESEVAWYEDQGDDGIEVSNGYQQDDDLKPNSGDPLGRSPARTRPGVGAESAASGSRSATATATATDGAIAGPLTIRHTPTHAFVPLPMTQTSPSSDSRDRKKWILSTVNTPANNTRNHNNTMSNSYDHGLLLPSTTYDEHAVSHDNVVKHSPSVSPAQSPPLPSRYLPSSSSTHSLPNNMVTPESSREQPRRHRKGILVPADRCIDYSFPLGSQADGRGRTSSFGQRQQQQATRFGSGAGAGGGAISGSDNYAIAWMQRLGRLELVDQVLLPGFTLLAVDKWVLDRTKCFRTALRVGSETSSSLLNKGTSDTLEHAVNTFLLCPRRDVPEDEVDAELDEVKRKMARYGLRPIEIPDKGIGDGTEEPGITVMVLAAPRNDAQYIPIPGGDFRSSQDSLYVNINLKRFGCAGRLSLSLEPTSATCQQRFCEIYRLPGGNQRESSFNDLVLELVKLVQTALYLFGLYGCVGSEEIDGLLCNETLAATRKWRATFSKDPIKRQQDYPDDVYMAHLGPEVVAELLSTVSCIRYKLGILDIEKTPYDPFSRVSDFETALFNFQRLRHRGGTPLTAHLTPMLIKEINDAYAKEAKTPKRKLKRLVRTQVSQAGMGLANNLDFLNLGNHHKYDSNSEEDPVFSADEAMDFKSQLPPDRSTTSIEQFQKAVLINARHKHTVGRGRVRALWEGNVVHIPVVEKLAPRQITLSRSSRPTTQKTIESNHASEEHRIGTGIRSGVSRTGHALRDGFTNLTRRGLTLGETSDSEGVSRSRRSNPNPIVMLQSGSGDESTDSRQMTASPGPPSKLRLRLPETLTSRGIQTASASPNSQLGISSAHGSGLSINSGSDQGLRPASDERWSSSSRRDGTTLPHLGLTRGQPRGHLLERIVSADNLAEIDDDGEGVEWIHSGHAEAEWQAHREAKRRNRGLIRRASTSDLERGRWMECDPVDHLQIDVDTCAAIWELLAQKRAFERRVQAFEVCSPPPAPLWP